MSLSSIAARRQLTRAARPVTQIVARAHGTTEARVLEHGALEHGALEHGALELVGATAMVFLFVVAAILA